MQQIIFGQNSGTAWVITDNSICQLFANVNSYRLLFYHMYYQLADLKPMEGYQ